LSTLPRSRSQGSSRVPTPIVGKESVTSAKCVGFPLRPRVPETPTGYPYKIIKETLLFPFLGSSRLLSTSTGSFLGSSLFRYMCSPSQPFFGMSRNAPVISQEKAAKATITYVVPFRSRIKLDSCPVCSSPGLKFKLSNEP